VQPPFFACKLKPGRFELGIVLATADLPGFPRLRLGLAVVKARGGALSYWALHHSQPKPDFHHPAAFAPHLDLSP